MTDLAQLRARIDAVDDAIVDLLARRFALCREVAEHKQKHGIPVVLPERIEAVKRRCAERAAARNVDPAFVSQLYDRIIGETCRVETEHQHGGVAGIRTSGAR